MEQQSEELQKKNMRKEESKKKLQYQHLTTRL